MKRLNRDELWDFCRGMNWVWDYCKTGTAAANAPGIKDWVERRGEFTANLKACRSVAAEIRRHIKDSFRGGIGTGFGQSTLS